MVSVLAITSKVCRFKPDRGDGFLRVIKIHSTTSLVGDVKLLAPRCKILRHVKKSLASTNKGKFVISITHSSCLVHDNSAGRIARELWWTSQFYSVDIILPWENHAHISPGRY
jgi:hypothetical protein